jgi:hypothetical protein
MKGFDKGGVSLLHVGQGLRLLQVEIRQAQLDFALRLKEVLPGLALFDMEGLNARAFNMCGDVATPNLYAVAQQNCLQAPDTRTTVMGRRSGSSSSNDDVERAGAQCLRPAAAPSNPWP